MGKIVCRFCAHFEHTWVFLRKCLFWTAFGFCFSAFLEAQYPSALYRSIESPMLAEPDSRTPVYYNPAFLGMGIFNRDVSFRSFHLRVLDVLTSLKFFTAFTLTDLPNFEESIGKKISKLVVGLSVDLTSASSFGEIFVRLDNAYAAKLAVLNIILRGIATDPTKRIPNSLSQAEIEGEIPWQNYKNTLEKDTRTLLTNNSRILGAVVTEYLKDQPLFNSQAYLRLLDAEFLLGEHVSLGFGINARVESQIRDDVSGLRIDNRSLNLPQLSLDGINLPTNESWRDATDDAATELLTALANSTGQYTNARNALLNSGLVSLALQQMFAQDFISFYYAIEPSLRLSLGFSLTNWLYLGMRLHSQLFLGMDNRMIPRNVLDLNNLGNLAKYIFSPINYQLGLHIGFDMSLLFWPFEWAGFSIMLTDLLGLAQGKDNTSAKYWGDFYYPIDLQLGGFAVIPLGANFRLGLGLDVYNLVSMIFQRSQRFDLAGSFSFIDHLRAKLTFEYNNQFRIMLHYWQQGVGVALQLDFSKFHPSVGVEMDFDLQDIRINLDILRFTN